MLASKVEWGLQKNIQLAKSYPSDLLTAILDAPWTSMTCQRHEMLAWTLCPGKVASRRGLASGRAFRNPVFTLSKPSSRCCWSFATVSSICLNRSLSFSVPASRRQPSLQNAAATWHFSDCMVWDLLFGCHFCLNQSLQASTKLLQPV